jgi:hypothetical protein
MGCKSRIKLFFAVLSMVRFLEFFDKFHSLLTESLIPRINVTLCGLLMQALQVLLILQ